MDVSGEVVCASAQDTFEVFVWSMQTGRLLEVVKKIMFQFQCLLLLRVDCVDLQSLLKFGTFLSRHL